MSMKKSNAIAMMLMMGGILEHQSHINYRDEDLLIVPSNKKPIKKIIPKGLKEFYYGEVLILAINKKNADRKAKNKGLI